VAFLGGAGDDPLALFARLGDDGVGPVARVAFEALGLTPEIAQVEGDARARFGGAPGVD
jgi:hypothetical protein